MNIFFAKEYTIIRGTEHWEHYPGYIKWCKDNIGVRGDRWEWEKGYLPKNVYNNPNHPWGTKQIIKFLFDREEDYVQFLLTHIA